MLDEKKTKELLAKGRGNQNVADMQAIQGQIQAISQERANNLALAKQEIGSQEATSSVLAEAGQLLAPSSAGVLAKYGYQAAQGTAPAGPPKQSSTKTVQSGPTHITINNNTTVHNSGGGAGPVQGRAISFKQDIQMEQQASQNKFKTWIQSIFAKQREETAKRERQYARRDSELSKSVNKLLNKMSATTREVVENMNPQKIGTTLSGQIKTLLFLFASTFLVENWEKVLDFGLGIYNGIKAIGRYFGVGEDGKLAYERGERGTLKGDLYWFFTGKSPKQGETVLGLFKKLFDDLIDHVKTYLEWQMERRSIAMKNISFPSLDLTPSNKEAKFMGFDLGPLLAGLGDVFGKAFSGVSNYLGDILTALVNPEAGIQKAAETQIKTASVASSDYARERELNAGVANEFTNSDVDSSVNYGDYALVSGKGGNKKYSMNMTALDVNGDLNNSAGASVSQGRDILGAFKDAKEYGYVDTSRVVAGLQRLYDSSKRNGQVVVDKEFLQQMFGKIEGLPGVKPVQMKFVVGDMSDQERAAEKAYAVQRYGASGWFDGLTSGAWNGASGYAIDALGGDYNAAPTYAGLRYATKHGGGKLVKKTATKLGGKAAGKVAGKVAGKFIPGVGWADVGVGAAIGLGKGIASENEQNEKKYELVPLDDPRPAAIGGVQTMYAIEPQALENLAKTKFNSDNFSRGNYTTLLAGAENNLKNYAGGEAALNRTWNLRGKEVFGEDQYSYGTDSYNQQMSQLKNIDTSYRRRLDGSAWSQDVNNMVEHASQLYNMGASWLSSKINTYTVKLKPGQSTENGHYVMSRLMSELDLTKEQAAGVVGNLNSESGMNPTAGCEDNNGKYAGGLAGWNGDNFTALENHARRNGKNPRSLEAQTDFLIDTLRTKGLYYGGPEVLGRLKQAKTPEEAAEAFFGYERFLGWNLPGDNHKTVGKNGKTYDLTGNKGKRMSVALAFAKSFNEEDAIKVKDRADQFQQNSSTADATGSEGFTSSFQTEGGTSLQSTNSIAIMYEGGNSESFSLASYTNSGNDSSTFIPRFRGINGVTEGEEERLAFCGDSYAQGIQLYCKGFPAAFFPPGNEKTGKTLKWIAENGIIPALNQGFKTIIVYGGVNNFKQSQATIQGEYELVINTVKNNGATIFLCTQVSSKRADIDYGKINMALVTAAKKLGAGVIDVAANSAAYQQYIGSDNLHLTPEGFRKLGEEILNSLRGGGTANVDPEKWDASTGYINIPQLNTLGEEGLQKLNSEVGLKSQAAELWQLAQKDFNGTIQVSIPNKNSAEEFIDWYSKASEDQRVNMEKSISNIVNSASAFDELNNNGKMLSLTSNGAAGLNKKEFVDYYKRLNDAQREGMDAYLEQLSGYENWRNTFSKDIESQGVGTNRSGYYQTRGFGLKSSLNGNEDHWTAEDSKEQNEAVYKAVYEAIVSGMSDADIKEKYLAKNNGALSNDLDLTLKELKASILNGDKFQEVRNQLDDLTNQQRVAKKKLDEAKERRRDLGLSEEGSQEEIEYNRITRELGRQNTYMDLLTNSGGETYFKEKDDDSLEARALKRKYNSQMLDNTFAQADLKQEKADFDQIWQEKAISGEYAMRDESGNIINDENGMPVFDEQAWMLARTDAQIAMEKKESDLKEEAKAMAEELGYSEEDMAKMQQQHINFIEKGGKPGISTFIDNKLNKENLSWTDSVNAAYEEFGKEQVDELIRDNPSLNPKYLYSTDPALTAELELPYKLEADGKTVHLKTDEEMAADAAKLQELIDKDKARGNEDELKKYTGKNSEAIQASLKATENNKFDIFSPSTWGNLFKSDKRAGIDGITQQRMQATATSIAKTKDSIGAAAAATATGKEQLEALKKEADVLGLIKNETEAARLTQVENMSTLIQFLGETSPNYKAVYSDGKWQLQKVSQASETNS